MQLAWSVAHFSSSAPNRGHNFLLSRQSLHPGPCSTHTHTLNSASVCVCVCWLLLWLFSGCVAVAWVAIKIINWLLCGRSRWKFDFAFSNANAIFAPLSAFLISAINYVHHHPQWPHNDHRRLHLLCGYIKLISVLAAILAFHWCLAFSF